jgi:hypothetical protein
MIIKKVGVVVISFKGIFHRTLSQIFNKNYHKYWLKKLIQILIKINL